MITPIDPEEYAARTTTGKKFSKFSFLDFLSYWC